MRAVTFLAAALLCFALCGCAARQPVRDESANLSVSAVSQSQAASAVSSDASASQAEGSAEASSVPQQNADAQNGSAEASRAAPAQGIATSIPQSIEPQTITVTLSIDGSAGAQTGLLVRLDAVSLRLSAGATVFDALQQAAQDNGLAVTYSGKASRRTVYVQGIGGLSQMDGGKSSGWIYYVNGVFANVSCSAHLLQNGDKIEWKYVV